MKTHRTGRRTVCFFGCVMVLKGFMYKRKKKFLTDIPKYRFNVDKIVLFMVK